MAADIRVAVLGDETDMRLDTGKNRKRRKRVISTGNPSAGSQLPLRLAGEGDMVCIADLKGGKDCFERLSGLGLRVGAVIEIIRNPMGGKMIVRHGETRIFLGGGMANKISVTLIQEDRDEDNS